MVDLLYSPQEGDLQQQQQQQYIDNLIPEDNVERLRNIRDMFENSSNEPDGEQQLLLHKVDKVQPSEKLMQRLSNVDLHELEFDELDHLDNNTNTNPDPISIDNLKHEEEYEEEEANKPTSDEFSDEENSPEEEEEEEEECDNGDYFYQASLSTSNQMYQAVKEANGVEHSMLTKMEQTSQMLIDVEQTAERSISGRVSPLLEQSSPTSSLTASTPHSPHFESYEPVEVDYFDPETPHRFQEGADSESIEAEDDDAENNEEGGSHSEEAPIKSNRRFNKKKDIIPFAEMNNVMSKFEKIGHESEQSHAPKPIRSITPPRRGANRVEIENEPQQRAADVVSAFEKIEDTLPQQGFIRHRKEQFSSPHTDNIDHKSATAATDDIAFGSAKLAAAMFANGVTEGNERWANRLKSIEKSGISLEGELAEKGIAKSRLALFNETANPAQQQPTHLLNEADSEIIKSATGIAKERVNLFKHLEQQQQGGGMRTSPSREFKKMKEFTPPPQLDHPQRQYIIIDKEETAAKEDVSRRDSYHIEEFVPESGLAKSRMKQYLESSQGNGANNNHADSDEVVSKGYAKSLLAKWKSMETMENKEASPEPPSHHPGKLRFRALSKEGSPNAAVDCLNQEDQLPLHGNAKNLLNKWQNIDSNGATKERRAPRQITPPPNEELHRNKSMFESPVETPLSNKTVMTDQELGLIGRGHAKSTLAKFEQSVIESTTHIRKTITPPREFINKAISGQGVQSVYESTPAESSINAQFCEEDVIPSPGHAKQLKSKFLNLEKEAAKVETSSSKMHYVPKKFTSAAPAAPAQTANTAKPAAVNKLDAAKLAAVEAGPQSSSGSSNNKQENQQAYLNHHQSTLHGGDKCCVCEKTVYAMEKIEADKKVYHKLCFKCNSCNCTLNEDGFVIEGNKPFCLKHMSKVPVKAPPSPAKVPPQSPAKSAVPPQSPAKGKPSMNQLMEPIRIDTSMRGDSVELRSPNSTSSAFASPANSPVKHSPKPVKSLQSPSKSK